MAAILILYSSVDGQTLRICNRLRAVLEEAGNRVSVCPVDDSTGLDLHAFDSIVIGASVRYGHHRPAVLDFIRQHRTLLESKPNAFFSVNIVARKAGKNRPETNPYLQKFLGRIDWKPDRLAVFAGRLDYPNYGFLDRQLIRLIMWTTGGPTDPATVVEFTDWQEVEAFGRDLGRSSTMDLPSAPDVS